MKYLIMLTLISLSYLALATKPNQTLKHSLNYKALPCKQKILPVKIDYDVKGNRAFIKITAESDIHDFSISKLRGIDGLQVLGSVDPKKENILRDESILLEVDFTKPEGLSYLVTDLTGNLVNGTKRQTIAIPIGEFSANQQKEKQRNVRSTPILMIKKNSKSPLHSKQEEKFHYMKLE